jgi:hypothetical protein
MSLPVGAGCRRPHGRRRVGRAHRPPPREPPLAVRSESRPGGPPAHRAAI